MKRQLARTVHLYLLERSPPTPPQEAFEFRRGDPWFYGRQGLLAPFGRLVLQVAPLQYVRPLVLDPVHGNI